MALNESNKSPLSVGESEGSAPELGQPVLPDRSSSMPLFAQLVTELRERLNRGLASGELKPGELFATEKELCQKYGVSTITAKRALDDLEAERLVVRHRGRGTFVAQPRIIQNLDHFYRFTTEMRNRGYQTTWKNLSVGIVKPDLGVREALNLGDGEKAVCIERLRFVNSEPFFLHRSYLPEKLFPGLEHEDHENIALYDLLARKYHAAPVRCRDTFEPGLIHQREALLLEVPPRSPGMLLERIAYSVEGVPVEFSRGVIRGDRCRLTVDLH